MSSRAPASCFGPFLAVVAASLAAGKAGAAVSFLEPRALPLPVDGGTYAGVYGVASGDFDGDGRLDLAATGAGLVAGGDQAVEHDFVAVLQGNGDGTFQAPVIVDLGPRDTAQPGGIAAADLDGDGRLDLAFVTQRTRQIGVLLGRGDGTFGDPAFLDTGADALTDLRLADLDRDGKLDLVAVSMNADLAVRQLALLVGDGHGGFASPMVKDVGRLPQGLAVADVDGRNGPDILVACRVGALGGGTVEVLLNDGSGGFPATATAFPARTSPFGVWVADFDGDGKLDALVPGWEGALQNTCGTGCVALLRGDGRGSLTSPTEADVWKAEGWVVVNTGDTAPLDLNGDGKPDAIFGHFGGLNEVTTFLSRPGGGHATEGWVASPGSGLPVMDPTLRVDGNHVLGIVAGDFDGDGTPDLVAASQGDTRAGGLSFLRGVAGAPGTFEAPRVLSAPRGGYYAIPARSLSLGDLTGDGKRDLLFFTGTLDTFPGLGGGLLGSPIDGLGVVGSEGYNTLRTGDLDRDGELDALFLGVDGVQGGNPPRHILALGRGDGTFGSLQQLLPQTAGSAGRNAALADLEGDGDLDVVVLTAEVGFSYILTKVETWLNDGGSPPVFTPGGVAVVQSSGTLHSSGLVAADFDGDGKADAVVHRLGPSDDLLFLGGTGDGHFRAAVPISSEVGQPIDTLLAGDLDEDGKLDLVALGTWGGAYVMLGRGDGTFLPRAAHDIAEGASDGTIVDLDGDGHLDVLSAAVNGLAVLPGRGDGTFSARRPFATGVTASAALAAGDLDGDGKPELVVGHGSAANRHFLTLLENASGPLADLSVSASRTPATLHVGELATVTFAVSNHGPDAAGGATLRSPLRQGLELFSSAATPGTCGAAGGAVSCDLGSLPAGGGATVTLRLRPATEGTRWVTASAASTTPEANGADDAASISAVVLPRSADLRVSLSGAPDPVTVGQPLGYTATVTNDGPSMSLEVSLAVTLPSGAPFVSATPSAGTCAHPAVTTVTCSLGALDAGQAATVTVVVTPGAAGTLTAGAQVSSTSPDPHATDDQALASATAVQPPARGKNGGCGCGVPVPDWLSGLPFLVLALRRRAGGRPRRTRPGA
jgi:uncharacterized repeat protein (TIGR01451 family)